MVVDQTDLESPGDGGLEVIFAHGLRSKEVTGADLTLSSIHSCAMGRVEDAWALLLELLSSS